MLPWLSVMVYLLCGALALWGLWRGWRDRKMNVPLLIGAGVVEIALLLELVIAAVVLLGGTHPDEPVTFVGYLITALIVVPAAAGWGVVERSKWGSFTLAVAAFVVLVMQVRLDQLWVGGNV